MTLRALCLLAVLGNVLAMSAACAQEGPGSAKPGATGAAAVSGPEKRYVDMSKSKDRVLKATAERYLALIKFQEWTGASGKTQTAKYISHDPDMSRVKLSIATGTGKERTRKEVEVDVAKLNKVCQARVKQIDLLQKRLEELAVEATKNGETFAAAETANPGAAAPGSEVAATGPEAPGATPTAPAEDPSASEPDPLGFAELPAVAAPPMPKGASIENATIPESMPSITTPQSSKLAASSWQTDYAAFRANFRGSSATDPGDADWGTLKALKAAADEVKKWEATGEVGEKEHREIAKKFAAVGEFTWETTLAEADVSSGDWTQRLSLPALPEPFSIGFVLEKQYDPGKWQGLKTGDRVRFAGRFVDIENGADIVAAIRFPDLK